MPGNFDNVNGYRTELDNEYKQNELSKMKSRALIHHEKEIFNRIDELLT